MTIQEAITKLIQTQQILSDNSAIPYWQQMEILNNLEKEDLKKLWNTLNINSTEC